MNDEQHAPTAQPTKLLKLVGRRATSSATPHPTTRAPMNKRSLAIRFAPESGRPIYALMSHALSN
jgi:hypothetical protein